jgi:hypothetical protein
LQTNKNKIKPISLQQCKKTCACDGQVHAECINAWFKHTPICPICRNAIVANNNILGEQAYYDLIIYAVWTITIIIIIFVLPTDRDYY